MGFNKFRYYTILFFIKQIAFEIFVSATTTDTDMVLLKDNQMAQLANYVCSDLDYYLNVTLDTCQEEFWRVRFPPIHYLNELQKSPVKIRCSTEYSVRFIIEASANWQLVLLLPEIINDADDIKFSLIDPMLTHGVVYTLPYVAYTVWSAELIEGSPVQWYRSDNVTRYIDLTLPKERDYHVKVQQYTNEEDNRTILNGLFHWETVDNTDVCFDVTNSCESDIRHTIIWPDQKPEILFKNLLPDTSCKIQIIGLYGTTNFEYRTLNHSEPLINKSYSNCVPDVPQDVYIEASEDGIETWKVLVSWARANNTVDSFNITLLTHPVFTHIVDGNATETIFRGVKGEGFYNVLLYAKCGKYEAHTSRRALFPGRMYWVDKVVRAVMAGTVVSAVLVLAVLYIWRRRRHTASSSYYPSVIKLPLEDDTEAVHIVAESGDSWELRPDKLTLHEVIGEGAFGVVRRATLAPNGTNVAVKMLKDFPSQEEIRSFRSEMELMKSVGVHPHLVSLVGCCSGRRPLIVAEYCSRGDLLSYLRCTWDIMVSKRNAKYHNNNLEISDYRHDLFKCKTQENSKLVVNKLYELQEICDKELTSLDLLSFCRQIAIGMEFLAANRVVHRDLAARNILVTADRTLKIADFGLSRDVYEENQYKQKGNGKMPVKWMALESLTRRIYTTQSDVWSFGVVVWEVATVGASPYASVPAARLPRLLRAGYRMPKPANCSQELYDMMVSCWRERPRGRPTFAALHARLDELVLGASAHHYLPLELDPLDVPPTPPAPRTRHRYISMLIGGKRKWSGGESYERPLKPPQSNHYSSPPAVLTTGTAV